MAQPQTPAPQPTQTEVGQDGGGHAAFPPFQSDTFPSQLLWLAISFGALYYFMAKKALPAVGATIKQRKDRIAKDIDDATAMQQKADAAADAHKKALADAYARAQSLAQATRDQLAAEADAKRKGIEATRERAMASVGVIAREATAAIVERLIGRPAKPEAIAAAVDSQKPG
jgi:F-type H+-transporting ATPase subunit b